MIMTDTNKLTEGFLNVSSLRVRDTVPGMYAEKLEKLIAAEYRDKLFTAVENVSFEKDLKVCKSLYTLEMLDTAGKVIDSWDVDLYRTVQNAAGKRFFRDGVIDRVLSELEKDYSLGSELLKRAPGDNYSAFLDAAVRARLCNLPEEPFENMIEYLVPKKMLTELKQRKNDVLADSVKKDGVKSTYSMKFYNEDGNSVQIWYFGDNGRLYSCGGYELKGFPTTWFAGLMKELLL